MSTSPSAPVEVLFRQIVDPDSLDAPWRFDSIAALPIRTMVGPSMESHPAMARRLEDGRLAVGASAEWLFDYREAKRWVEITGSFSFELIKDYRPPLYWYFFGNVVPSPHFLVSHLEMEASVAGGSIEFLQAIYGDLALAVAEVERLDRELWENLGDRSNPYEPPSWSRLNDWIRDA